MSTVQKRRVNKACDYCRGKKLKCDGAVPSCLRCSKVHNKCTYNHVEKKRTRRPKHLIHKEENGSNSLGDSENGGSTRPAPTSAVDSRLKRLETVITTLVKRLDYSSILTTTPDYEDEDDEEVPNNFTDHDESDEMMQSPEQLSPDEQNYNGQYFGSHCTFSVFSPKGLSYIASKCKDPHSMDRVVKMQRDVYYVLYNQYKKRVEPAPETEIIPIPPKELTDKLIDSFLKTPIGFTNSAMDEKEVRDRFAQYYENESKGANKRELTQSEYLILHSVIGLGAAGQVSKLSKELSLQSINKNEIQFFKHVEEKHMMSALYFYHRLTIFGDGLNGVKSILLLIAYSESSLIPDLDYLLTSSIVRFAQSIGLHRREALFGISDEEALTRKMIWLNCYVYDKDLCLKSGKPPIINDLDVSSLSNDEYSEFLHDLKNSTIVKLKGYKNLNFGNLHHIEDFLRNLLDSPFGIARYFQNFKLKIAKISSEVYFSLFSATALDGKSKRDVMSIVRTLNEALFDFKESLPTFIRPGFQIKIPRLRTEEETDGIYSQAVKLQLSYHLNVMNINRIGLNKDWNDDEASANLCLDSARQIIKLTQRIKEDNSTLYLSSLFVLLSASVTCFSYIIENPTKPSTKYDILLMHDTSEKFIERLRYMELQSDPINTMKFLSVIHVIKNFVKISTELYNRSNEDIEENSKLDLPNNDRFIGILEDHLSICFKQIKKKHGFSNSGTQQPLSSNGGPITTNIPTSDQSTIGLIPNRGGSSSSTTFPDPSNPEFQPLQPQLQQNPFNYILNDPIPDTTNSLNAFDDFMTDDLLDMTYFSQSLFNIPNFLFGESNKDLNNV